MIIFLESFEDHLTEHLAGGKGQQITLQTN